LWADPAMGAVILQVFFASLKNDLPLFNITSFE
jgi:hypothetical protein